MRRILAIVAVWSLATCDEPAADLSVRVRGCVEVRKGPTCAIGEESLRVFVESEDELSVTIDGHGVDTETVSIDGGQRFQITPTEGQHIDVRTADGRFRFVTTSPSKTPLHEASRAARRSLRAGQWSEAEQQLAVAAAAHERSGHTSASVLDRQARAYTLIYSGLRLDDAKRALDAAEASMSFYGEGYATQPYYRGLLALESGDYRGAIGHLDEARRRLSALDMQALVFAAGEARVAALATLGARDEAMATLDRLERSDVVMDACTRARHTNNLAWLRLIDADAASRSVPAQLVDELSAAVRTFETDACRQARALATARVHLGLAHVLNGAPADALRAIDGLVELAPDVDYWRTEVTGRAHLALREFADAARVFNRAQDIAARGSMIDAKWRATTFLGDVHAAAGRHQAALETYDAAERLLDDRSLELPLGRGRAGFLGDRHGSAGRLARLSIETGAPERAACVLRLANRRIRARAARAGQIARLTGPDRETWERQVSAYRRARAAIESERAADWDLPIEERAAREKSRSKRARHAEAALDAALELVEHDRSKNAGCEVLRRPQNDETILLVDRVDADRFAIVLIDADTTDARIVEATKEGLAEVVVDALLDNNLAATVRVLWTASSAHVDVHALNYAGQPLAASKRVVYSLDIDATPVSSAGGGHALVVGNPTRNLRASADEAHHVAGRLAAFGFGVDRRIGRDASPARVLRDLESSAMFHFAGHGRASTDGPFDDHLELFGGVLSAADVLALSHVPSQVVLSGCRTGRITSERMNLASAFVLAGADVVVASTRDVPDDSAFGRALYDARPAQRQIELIGAYHRAAVEAVPGWSAFRVWVK